jgi:hypothetical protein
LPQIFKATFISPYSSDSLMSDQSLLAYEFLQICRTWKALWCWSEYSSMVLHEKAPLADSQKFVCQQ